MNETRSARREAPQVLRRTLQLIESQPQSGYTPEWVAETMRVGDVTALAVALRH